MFDSWEFFFNKFQGKGHSFYDAVLTLHTHRQKWRNKSFYVIIARLKETQNMKNYAKVRQKVHFPTESQHICDFVSFHPQWFFWKGIKGELTFY